MQGKVAEKGEGKVTVLCSVAGGLIWLDEKQKRRNEGSVDNSDHSGIPVARDDDKIGGGAEDFEESGLSAHFRFRWKTVWLT